MARWARYNPSPDGKTTGDCVIRALSRALGLGWVETYCMLAARGLALYDMPSANHVWGSLLRSHGFVQHVPETECPDCYTVGEFADEHPDGVHVIGTGYHAVCVERGVVFDTWDSRREAVAYYWSKEDQDAV
jgi:hypothetical protein